MFSHIQRKLFDFILAYNYYLIYYYSRKFSMWEVLRDEEFSPLKNSDDSNENSPTTCRNDLFAQHKRWLVKLGYIFEDSNK